MSFDHHLLIIIIIPNCAAALLMKLLFEVTEVDFELSVELSSFLDETWVIPVVKTIHLPPLKSLDIKIK